MNAGSANNDENKNDLTIVSIKKALILDFDACQYDAGFAKDSASN